MNPERYLLVVSGPSGVGKDTVVRRMRELHPEVGFSVSATTRAPREGEADGVDYHFLTKEAFERHIADNTVVEYTCYCGNYYGTLCSEIEPRMERGEPVVLVIEVEGAENIKRKYPECTTVFVLPPSREELRRHLSGRGTEDSQRRMTIRSSTIRPTHARGRSTRSSAAVWPRTDNRREACCVCHALPVWP